MRKKKVENLIFNILFLMPIIIFMGYLLINVVSANNHDVLLSVSDLWANLTSSINNNVVGGPVYDAISYFLNIFNVNTLIVDFVSMYVQYVICIELVHFLFDVFIFVPRCVRQMFTKGVDY